MMTKPRRLLRISSLSRHMSLVSPPHPPHMCNVVFVIVAPALLALFICDWSGTYIPGNQTKVLYLLNKYHGIDGIDGTWYIAGRSATLGMFDMVVDCSHQEPPCSPILLAFLASTTFRTYVTSVLGI